MEFYERDDADQAKPKRQSLGHKDQGRAKQQADEISAQFGIAPPSKRTDSTLATLFDKYDREVSLPLKGKSKQGHDRRAAKMFLGFFGANRKASSLSVTDWNRFIAARRAGSVGPSGRPVRNRQIEYDLKFLLAVLNWATVAREDGEPLLDRNPLKGLKLPREESPHRPMLSEAEEQALVQVVPDMDWRLGVAWVLCRETGHRIGAVSRLRWEDVDLDGRTVTWRAANDKKNREHVTPLTDSAVAALKQARSHSPISPWVLPSPRGCDAPVSERTLARWRRKAMDAAGLGHLRRVGFHCLRWKFASELMDEPLKVLMALGGWKDPKTVIQCYQKADPERMRQALESRNPLTQSTHPGLGLSGMAS
ncbi:MAG: site-specific integrase [Gemmatimonadetes bacterium]|nr:site-specific integrase [Gemmatimonadota bacterium]